MSLALSIENLTKTYDNGFQALKGIDLQVAEGDFFALLGPNGAGKSTTIGIIASLVNKTSGRIRVFDKDIDKDFAGAKRYLGLVPQEFNFNVFEPIEEIVVNQAGYYGIERREALARAKKCLQQLGLWEKRRDSGRLLSGGMKRRLMIARALVHRPRLLILDEPTAGVDIEIRRTMWEFIREINQQGTTIILTTHYLEEAENLCRNVAIINHGQVVEHTSVRNLIQQLNMETFILDIKHPVNRLPRLPGCHLKQLDELSLEVEVPKSMVINDLFASLSQHGIEVLSMRNKSNRLETLFMGLVNNSNPSLVGRPPASLSVDEGK